MLHKYRPKAVNVFSILVEGLLGRRKEGKKRKREGKKKEERKIRKEREIKKLHNTTNIYTATVHGLSSPSILMLLSLNLFPFLN